MKTSIRILTAFIIGTTSGILLGKLCKSEEPKPRDLVNGDKDHEGSYIHKFFKEKKKPDKIHKNDKGIFQNQW